MIENNNITGGTDDANEVIKFGGVTDGAAITVTDVPENNKVVLGDIETLTGDIIDAAFDGGKIVGGTFENAPTELGTGIALTTNSDGSSSAVVAQSSEIGTVIFDVYPASADVTIYNGTDISTSDEITTGKHGAYTLPAGNYAFKITKPGYESQEGVFEVAAVADKNIAVTLKYDPDSEEGFGITLAGPYHYDTDANAMLTVAEAYNTAKADLEYGDPVYYLILDDTCGGAPLSAFKAIEKLKVKAEWNEGAELVKGMDIVKKYVNMSDTALNCNKIIAEFEDGSCYCYFLEIQTGEKKTISESDVFGAVEFDRKANKKNGNNIEEIDGCKRNIDFTLFYPNTWNSEAAIVSEKTAIEWDKNYALKFDSDDEVELTFGYSENEGRFTVDASGQSKLFLKYDTKADEAIADANPGVKMHFINFQGINGGVKFNRIGEFTYELEDGVAAYKVVDGALVEIAGLEVDDGEFKFNTNTLGSYVFADAELVNP